MTHALTVALTLQSPSDMGNGARYIPLDFQRFSFISSFWSKSLSRFHIPRGIRHEMPTSSPQDILAAIRTQRTSALSNLSSILDIISRRRISIFGHISQYCRTASRPTWRISVHVSASLCRPPDSSWRRRPGQPCGRWLDQIRRDTGQTPADHWRQAQRRGHRRGEGTLRP